MVIKDDVMRVLNRDAMTTPLPLNDVGGDAPDQTTALQLMHTTHQAQDHAACAALQRLALGGAIHELGTYQQGIELRSDTVDMLKGRGWLSTRDDGSGGREVAVNAAAVRWDLFLVCASPSLEVTNALAGCEVWRHSKWDLIGMLHREGFEGTWDRSVRSSAWTPGTYYYRSQSVLGGCKAYFACLVCRQAILAKGATSILHNSPTTKYYWLLLHLKDVRRVQALADAGTLTVNACDNLLKDGQCPPEVPDAPLPIRDADHEAPHDDAEADRMPVLLDGHAAEIDRLAPKVLPAIPNQPGLRVVHFDNCSHASGVMRGFVKCVWHEKCQRYMQVNVAGTKERLVASLHAWLLAGEGIASKEEHARHCVHEDVVQKHLRLLYPDA